MASEEAEQQISELNQQVEELHGQGKYAEALELTRQVCDLARRVLGTDHPVTARSLNNMGYLLGDMGDMAGSRPCLEQALEIRRVLGNDHTDTADSLNSLGLVLNAMGDLAGAQPYIEQALEIRRRVLGNDHPDTADSLNSLGLLLYHMGDFPGARPYFEQALEMNRRMLGNDHPVTARSLNNMGYLLYDMGDMAGSRPYLEQSLEIRRRVLGNDHPDTAASLNDLGLVLNAMGDLAGARPYIEQALKIRRRVLGNDHRDTADSLNNLGLVLQDMGDLGGARPYVEQALEVGRRVLGEDHPLVAGILIPLGTLEVASGRFDEALLLMRQASAINDRMIGQVFSVGSDQQRLLILKMFQGNQDVFLSLACRHLSHSPEAVRSAFDVVLRRKALGAEALAAQLDAVHGGRYPQLREAFEQLTQLRLRIAQKMLAGPASGETLTAHEQTLHQWRQDQQRRETELARQIPEVNFEQRLHKADRRAIALGLDEGVALVEFVRFRVFDFHAVPARGEQQWQPARYLAFVLSGGQPDDVQMIDLGEADPIDRMIADFRDSVAVDPQDRLDRDIRRHQTGTSPVSRGQVGPELRSAVFDKLIPALGLFSAPFCLMLGWLSPRFVAITVPSNRFYALAYPDGLLASHFSLRHGS